MSKRGNENSKVAYYVGITPESKWGISELSAFYLIIMEYGLAKMNEEEMEYTMLDDAKCPVDTYRFVVHETNNAIKAVDKMRLSGLDFEFEMTSKIPDGVRKIEYITNKSRYKIKAGTA